MLVANIPCTNLENATEVISGACSRALGAQKLPNMGLSDTAHRHFGHRASEQWKAGHLQQHRALVASLLWDVGELAHCSASTSHRAAKGTSSAFWPLFHDLSVGWNLQMESARVCLSDVLQSEKNRK